MKKNTIRLKINYLDQSASGVKTNKFLRFDGKKFVLHTQSPDKKNFLIKFEREFYYNINLKLSFRFFLVSNLSLSLS